MVNEWSALPDSDSGEHKVYVSFYTHWNYCPDSVEILYSIFIHCISLNSDFYWVIQGMVLGGGVATESQRGEVISPGPHSCQRQNWIPYKVRAGASPSRIAKGWKFSSLSIFCDNTNSHNSTQVSTIQVFSWAVAHLGPVLSLCPRLFHPAVIIPSLPPASPSLLSPNILLRTCLTVSGSHSSMLPQTMRPCFPTGSSTQAILSSLSHTDRGFRKLQLL